MNNVFFSKRLCSKERDVKTEVKIMEDFGNARQRYRVRAKFSTRSDNDNEVKSRRIPFTSHEVRYQIVADLIYWMLSSRFSSFSLFISIVFVLLTFIYALIIMAVVNVEPKCVTSSVFETDNGFLAQFNDAFALSWTTFTTVGYGAISPSTSGRFEEHEMHLYDKSGGCVLMSALLSYESLVGILFVSYAGAIMYVKLIQFQSNAQVAFSSIMVVKYGKGVEAGDVDEDASAEINEKDLQMIQKKIPFPVLVFRMVNLLNSTKNGEIVDAHVNTVATVNLRNAVMSHITRGNTVFSNALNVETKHKILGKRVYSYETKPTRSSTSERSIGSFLSTYSSRRRGGTGSKSNLSTASNTSLNSSLHSNRSTSSLDKSNSTLNQTLRNSMKVKNVMLQYGMSQEQIELTEKDLMETVKKSTADSSGDIDDFISQSINIHPPGLGECVIHKEAQVEMPNLVFSNVEMDPVDHPYFRTSWRVLHTLNETSPLLKKEVRNKIRDAGGSWPIELNHKEAIEESIDFDQFLVTFRGLSKSTGTTVYSHQVYSKEDMRIGYQFKSILVSNANGTIGIVPEDIDEIKAQDGGIP